MALEAKKNQKILKIIQIEKLAFLSNFGWNHKTSLMNFKRGRIFWATFHIEGNQIDISLDTSDQDEAEIKRDKIQLKLWEEKTLNQLKTPQKTFRELSEKYLAEHSKNKSPRSYLREESMFRVHLNPAFGSLFLHEIRPGKINDYRVQRKTVGAKIQTLNHELGLMKKAFNVAIRRGLQFLN